MNVKELIENAYRCGQNDGYDFRDEEINKLRVQIARLEGELEVFRKHHEQRQNNPYQI